MFPVGRLRHNDKKGNLRPLWSATAMVSSGFRRAFLSSNVVFMDEATPYRVSRISLVALRGSFVGVRVNELLSWQRLECSATHSLFAKCRVTICPIPRSVDWLLAC